MKIERPFWIHFTSLHFTSLTHFTSLHFTTSWKGVDASGRLEGTVLPLWSSSLPSSPLPPLPPGRLRRPVGGYAAYVWAAAPPTTPVLPGKANFNNIIVISYGIYALISLIKTGVCMGVGGVGDWEGVSDRGRGLKFK